MTLKFNPQILDTKETSQHLSIISISHQPELDKNHWKRPLDLGLAFLFLPLIIPILLLAILWIKLVSRGPALFRQIRVGKNGSHFTLYKLRSMKANAETARHEAHLRHLVETDSPMTKLDLLCDSRMITGGCLMRAAGIDELPQFLNVLRGEMSLVGPRPCMPDEYPLFSNLQRERFSVLPGITGCWQVNGKNRTTFSQMSAMDIDYVRNPSLLADLSIILRTPSVIARQFAQVLRNDVHDTSCPTS